MPILGNFYAKAIAFIAKTPLQPKVRLATQTAVVCVCFQRRSVRHNANDVPDRRTFASKERNLHCDLHVTAENKHTQLTAVWVARLVLDHAIAATQTSR